MWPYSFCTRIKVKLLPKCNLGSFCQCTWVKPSHKSIITMKAPLIRLNVFLFSGQNHFQWSARGIYYVSIKIAVFKTLRRLDTTLRTLFVYTEFNKRNVIEQLTLAVVLSTRHHPASREVSISKCDVKWRRVVFAPVRCGSRCKRTQSGWACQGGCPWWGLETKQGH